MKATELIRKGIEAIPLGEPFTPAIFLEFGTRAAVDQALARLAREGAITRVARGVYAKPRTSPRLGALPIPASKIAEAIVRSRGYPLQISGAEALNRLGLSTQVPVQQIYLTEGPARKIKLGKQVLQLKRVGPKAMAGAGTPAGTVISALRYLGKEGVTNEVMEKLERTLPEKVKLELKSHAPNVPSWMAEKLIRLGRNQGLPDG